jgi:hypothetical protein
LANVEEQETHTGYIRGEQRAYIYSEEPRWINILEKCVKDFPADVKITIKHKWGIELEYPVEWFPFNPPPAPRKRRTKKTEK